MIIIYCDGACRNNQAKDNIGAWAYHMVCDNGAMKEDCQAVYNTTNNIMELTAVIEALKALKPGAIKHEIEIRCDSQYVVKGINDWLPGWQKKAFSGVKNVDLWKCLLELKYKFPKIKFTHIKGHSGEKGNERVDWLCNKIMDLQVKQ